MGIPADGPAWHCEEELEVLRAGVQAVRRATGADVAMGGLAAGSAVVLRGFAGTRTTALHGLAIRAGAGVGGKAVARRRPVAVADYLLDGRITRDYDPYVAREGMRSIVGVPVMAGGEVAALLYAGLRAPVGIGDRTVERVTAVAMEVGCELAIRREVSRRVAALVAVEEVAAPAVGGAALEEVRAAHAELRAMAGDIADPALRQQLDAVSARLAEVTCGGPADRRPSVALTDREVDVLAQVALGCTNAETAERLGIGLETVKAHLRAASRKLGATTRHEAVVAARRSGWLP